MANAEWPMSNGKCQMENAKWQIPNWYVEYMFSDGGLSVLYLNGRC